jgi:CDP-glucose 4,6-dehydratase
MEISTKFWKGKKVLITGHTGFKGGWLSLWLQYLGADVIGFSLETPTNPSLYNEASVHENMVSIHGDIRNIEKLKSVFIKYKPEIVFHLAAQPLVLPSYDNPVETYEVNVMGTLNVLEAIRECDSVNAGVFITSDKCYENKEWAWGYRENDPVGGYDLYSSSKGCAELLVSSYRSSFFSSPGKSDKRNVAIATARAGNVIGGGDWGKNRLIPDLINAFSNNNEAVIRNPDAVRPWQHVLEPLAGYIVLAENLIRDDDNRFSEAWNFGPDQSDAQPVKWIVDKMVNSWPSKVAWKLDESHYPHEANYLKLDCSKAISRLFWIPKWNLDETITKVVDWYIAFNDKKDVKNVCLNQIREYMSSK